MKSNMIYPPQHFALLQHLRPAGDEYSVDAESELLPGQSTPTAQRHTRSEMLQCYQLNVSVWITTNRFIAMISAWSSTLYTTQAESVSGTSTPDTTSAKAADGCGYGAPLLEAVAESVVVSHRSDHACDVSICICPVKYKVAHSADQR